MQVYQPLVSYARLSTIISGICKCINKVFCANFTLDLWRSSYGRMQLNISESEEFAFARIQNFWPKLVGKTLRKKAGWRDWVWGLPNPLIGPLVKYGREKNIFFKDKNYLFLGYEEEKIPLVTYGTIFLLFFKKKNYPFFWYDKEKIPLVKYGTIFFI